MNRPTDKQIQEALQALSYVLPEYGSDALDGLELVATEIKRLRALEDGYTGFPTENGEYIVQTISGRKETLWWTCLEWRDSEDFTVASRHVVRWWPT